MTQIEFEGLRKEEDMVFVTFKLKYNHYLKLLKGALKNFCFFSLDNTQEEIKISERGKNEATKYFIIPLRFRKDFNYKSKVKFQRVEDGDNIHFIYSIKNKELRK